eukprot:GHVT01009477.1.p1 GENE.GHVT01009477.1~~GHVT01009477.1.p1  ORF type:complete len:482 (-),score=110.54 GHVT01009477.1:163-1608(-)
MTVPSRLPPLLPWAAVGPAATRRIAAGATAPVHLIARCFLAGPFPRRSGLVWGAATAAERSARREAVSGFSRGSLSVRNLSSSSSPAAGPETFSCWSKKAWPSRRRGLHWNLNPCVRCLSSRSTPNCPRVLPHSPVRLAAPLPLGTFPGVTDVGPLVGNHTCSRPRYDSARSFPAAVSPLPPRRSCHRVCFSPSAGAAVGHFDEFSLAALRSLGPLTTSFPVAFFRCRSSSGSAVARRGFSSSSSSFIRSVMDQVKKDMDSDASLRRAMEEFQQSEVRRRSADVRSRLGDAADRLVDASRSAAAAAKTAAEKVKTTVDKTQNAAKLIAQDSPQIKATFDAGGRVLSSVSSVLSTVVETTQKISEKLSGGEADAERKAAAWRQSMAVRRHLREKRADGKDGQAAVPGAATTAEEEAEGDASQVHETALVVAEETAWDRFGSRLRDMPFLSNFWENPVFGKLFGETEIAASIREMKGMDSNFR